MSPRLAYNPVLMPAACERILLIKPSSLGDVVLALPALSALRRNYPNARISWLIRPEFAPLVEGHPHLDEIIPFDRKFLGRAWRDPTALRELASLISRLRRGRFDVVLDLQGLFRSASLAWLSGGKRRLGPIWRKELARWFYTTAIPPRLEWVHVVDYYLKLIEATGAADLRVEFVLAQSPDAVASARRLLLQHDIDPSRCAILIPGSAQISKCWPAERFAALADRLVSDHGLTVAATGGAAEGPMIERIQGLAKHRIANLAGCTSLRELVEVLRVARLVVSNDTGPGHIAAALGKPLVMLFSWSNPLRAGPYGRPECVVARDRSSRGLAIKSHNPQHAIEHISFDEVYAAVCDQLQGGPVSGQPAAIRGI
ncbi:MAG: glycosyltransferase family 9 protein [Sedimentisphaerales bacterium]|nr:glycosyltransferase family 9 protein [Sedimentisphaerales bacterium]